MDDHSLNSDLILQKKASGGDENAFRSLYDRYYPRLYHYIFKIVKSKEVAEELAMDVFLKLWLARDMLAEIENLDAFLFRMAYNKSIDFFRAAAKDNTFTDLLWDRIQIPSHNTADAPLMLQEFESKLRTAINLLPPQRKLIFKLSREEGLTHSQIAGRLGISKNTVANSIVEARQFIKSYLSKTVDVVVLTALLASLFQNR